MSGGDLSGLDALCSTLCASFIDVLPVTGAALSAFSGSQQETMLHASDDLAARLDELQFDLGEGPRWEAARSRRPVLLPYVRSMPHERWPVFGKALTDTDAQALFVFPLVVGALDIGVVELYRSAPGELGESGVGLARALADGAAWSLLRRVLVPESGKGTAGIGLSPSRREIHQATGMVLAQTGGTAADALLLLRGHAFAHGQTVRQSSADVLERRLDFTPPAARERA
ncbi:GAF and ANTAR domain-containing protein [Arthrobacter sp. B0490]|uniref:GAF and ANTAR domain-containing protein n=1 Tax=Arthrobacter sp. B0490 TaxID=2058891 RepID=UPI00215751ED|nr:GAF and ANTAR domain-containing protein [Arthrobacter sp. B0490]